MAYSGSVSELFNQKKSSLIVWRFYVKNWTLRLFLLALNMLKKYYGGKIDKTLG